MLKTLPTLFLLLILCGCSNSVDPSDLPGTYRSVGFSDDIEITLLNDGNLILDNGHTEDHQLKWKLLSYDKDNCIPIELNSLRAETASRRLVYESGYTSNPCATRTLSGTIRIIVNADYGLYLDRVSDR